MGRSQWPNGHYRLNLQREEDLKALGVRLHSGPKLFCEWLLWYNEDMQKIIVYTDGGSRGNPGPAALGVYIETLEKRFGEFLGTKTNNEAEYAAIVAALKKVKSLIGKEQAKKAAVECRMDSELACRQLNHQYKIENARLQPLFLEVWNLMLDFAEVKFVHVPREQNTVADAEANRAMDEAEREGRNRLL